MKEFGKIGKISL